MKKQILAALLSFTFASVALLPSASAASFEQIDSKVQFAVAMEISGQNPFPAPVNKPANNPMPGTVARPANPGTVNKPKIEHKKRPGEIKKPKQRTPKPKISRPNNGKHKGQNKPDWKNKLPGIGKQKPNGNKLPNVGKQKPNGNNIPSTNPKGKTKVHGPHWCYGACSLHDAGLHNAPRTQKHWCDGYR